MLNKKTVKDIQVNSKKVLVRCDFNVPLDKNDSSKITSDKRIVESLKTINYLINAGAKVILCSHIGKTGQNLSLKPVAIRLSELLNKKVEFLTDILSDETKQKIDQMQNGDVVLLENLRMYKEEEENDTEFAKKLASLADVFVLDAFGTAHRAHASTVGVTKYLPSVAGFLIEKEINALDEAINNPKRPFIVIIGGAKVSSKIDVLNNLIDKADAILIGGGMAYTFIKAEGGKIGNSLCEDDKLNIAKQILEKAKQKNVEFLLPEDSLVADNISQSADTMVVESDNIPDGYMGVDIGPKTIAKYQEKLQKANTIVWNGPVGIFEVNKFMNGTQKIAETMANSQAVTVIGGGDSAAAVEKLDLSNKMTHVSTGGGASLEFMEGKTLPAIAALQDK